MLAPRMLSIALSTLTLAGLASAQCTVTPGHDLGGENLYVIGEQLKVTITTPANTLGALFISTSGGPTPSPWGTFCLGNDLTYVFGFASDGNPQSFGWCDLPCDPIYVGAKPFLQFVAFENKVPLTLSGFSNQLCFSIRDQLGSSQDFNVFSNTDISMQNGKTGGRMAAGDDIDLDSYQVGVELANSNGARDDAIAVDDLKFDDVTIANGNATYGNGDNTWVNNSSAPNGSFFQKAVPFSFDDEFVLMKRRSGAYASEPQNGTVATNGNTLDLTGTNTALNVFHLDASDLSGIDEVLVAVPSGSTVLVNIAGDTMTLRADLTVTGTASCATLWNFHQATWIKFDDIDVQGTIFAPCADMWFHYGNLEGTLIGEYIDGKQHCISENRFCGCIEIF